MITIEAPDEKQKLAHHIEKLANDHVRGVSEGKISREVCKLVSDEDIRHDLLVSIMARSNEKIQKSRRTNRRFGIILLMFGTLLLGLSYFFGESYYFFPIGLLLWGFVLLFSSGRAGILDDEND